MSNSLRRGSFSLIFFFTNHSCLFFYYYKVHVSSLPCIFSSLFATSNHSYRYGLSGRCGGLVTEEQSRLADHYFNNWGQIIQWLCRVQFWHIPFCAVYYNYLILHSPLFSSLYCWNPLAFSPINLNDVAPHFGPTYSL